jgi:hypothetical protein
MTRRRSARLGSIAIALTLLFVGCSGSDSTVTPTESSDSTVTTNVSSGTGGAGQGSSGGGTSQGGTGQSSQGSQAQPGGGSQPPTTASTQFVVPLLEGKTIAEARDLVRASGLTIAETNVSNAQAAGTVISQDPFPGRQLSSGDTVRVMVSTGQVIAMIPSVVGTCRVEAERLLARAGFVVSLRFDARATRKPNRVESQDPGGGIFDQQGSTVNLVISINPTGSGDGC